MILPFGRRGKAWTNLHGLHHGEKEDLAGILKILQSQNTISVHNMTFMVEDLT